MKLSIVDIMQVPPEGTPSDAIKNSIDLAKRLDQLGYERFWLAEHHGTTSLASHAPEILIPIIAGATQRIRVGSGAVLLNHYSPFKVAEQFRTLHALFPGRIDLGIGRAYAGPVAEVVLQRHRNSPRVNDYPEQVAELLTWITQEFPAPDHPYTRAPILADLKGWPEPWLLGSSQSSPVLAAELGLPYAFAGFISPGGAEQALRNYRNKFKPSESSAGIKEPRAILAMHVVCAETKAEAERLAMPVRAMYSRLAHGEYTMRLPTPEQAIKELGGLIEAEKEPWPRFVIGTPERVRDELIRMAKETHVDEIVIQDIIVSHADRVRSYELLAKAFDLV